MADAAHQDVGLRDALLAFGGEAAAVLAHPAVAAAVERGGGAALEKALRRARAVAGTREEAAVVDRMLGSRRLFLEPRRKAPTMFRVNGIGTALHGAADRARDGTYVGTLFFTFVFLPLLPLSAWLVRRAEGRGWHFFGRVPLSRAHRAWRLVVAGLVAAGLVAGFLHRPTPKAVRPTLHVVNELDVPLTIVVGDAARALGAHAVTSIELPPGTHAATARGPTAEVVEAVDLPLAADGRFYAWNVLGAAPLRVVTFEYVKTSTNPPPERPPTVDDFAGTSFVAAPTVHYPFREPPEQLRMYGETTTRRRAIVLEGGSATACTVLEGTGGAEAAAALAERVALATRHEPAIAAATDRAFAVGRPRLRAFAERAVVAAPGSVEAHRALQTAWKLDGRRDEAVATYRQAFEAKPGDGDAAYLYARLLPAEEALTIVLPALERAPRHARLLRSAAWNHLQRRAFAAAVDAFDRLERVDVPMARELLSERARALVGVGRVEDAQRVALARVEAGDFAALFVYGRLRPLAAADATLPTVAALLRKVLVAAAPDDAAELLVAALVHDRAYFDRVVARAPSLDAALRDAARVILVAATDVAAAADLVAALPPEAFARPSPCSWDLTTRVSVACELLRTGRDALARRFFEADGDAWFLTLDALGDPAPAAADDELDLEIRAALLYAAARRTTDPARREALLAEARAFDLYRCVVPPDAR